MTEKCEHGAKITHFCIYEYCAAKDAAGCDNCIKKYHSHVGQGDIIRTEEVDQLAQKFNVQNSVKPKCRQFQQHVFSFFTQVKSEISQTIDIVCKGMVNKIGYPLLSHLNHLPSYKRIKNKEYKKLAPKELKKIYLDCRGLDMGSVTIRERELYVEEIVDNFAIIEGMEKLMREYENLAKKLCKNFKHDSSAYKKIQDLKKYLNTVLKLDKRESSRASDSDSKPKESQLQTSPSDDKHFPRQNSSSKHLKQKQQKPSQPKQQSQRQYSITFNSSSITKLNNESVIKLESERSGSRSKYKHLRSFSIEKQVKIDQLNAEYEIKITPFQSNTYESKEREINERKEKLMKMMSMKERSLGKHVQSSERSKADQSSLLQPPLLMYQKNLNQPQQQRPKKSPSLIQHFSRIQNNKKSPQTSIRMERKQIHLKKQLSTNNLLAFPRTMRHSNSVHSLKQQLTVQNCRQEAKNQQDDEQKYKYGMGRLPSSDSNSSDAQNYYLSYINSISRGSKQKQKIDECLEIEDLGKNKPKRDRMTESTPIKIQLSNSPNVSDVVSDEEKSAALYLVALQNKNIDECIKYLKAALSYSPRNISAAEHLSAVYIQNSKAKQCLDLCNEYITLLVKLSKPELKRHFLINKSAALNSIGRYSESIMLLEAEAIHFEEAKMYKNLADAYYFVGINEKCQYNYEKAIRMNPRLDEAMYNLAACIFAQGNFYIADIWIAKALQIEPNNSDYQILKKEVQKRLADVNKESEL